MKPILFLVILNFTVEMSYGQTTIKQNKILSRKKRFLTFPEGSKLGVGIV